VSVHPSVRVSVRDSLSHAYVRSIARREPRRLPACFFFLGLYVTPCAIVLNIFRKLQMFQHKQVSKMCWTWLNVK